MTVLLFSLDASQSLPFSVSVRLISWGVTHRAGGRQIIRAGVLLLTAVVLRLHTYMYMLLLICHVTHQKMEKKSFGDGLTSTCCFLCV